MNTVIDSNRGRVFFKLTYQKLSGIVGEQEWVEEDVEHAFAEYDRMVNEKDFKFIRFVRIVENVIAWREG